jgi:chemotaxis protein CheX
MDPQYITPFIISIQNVFSTMLQLPVTIEEPRLKSGNKATYDVSGIIGMAGDVSGSVVLSFRSDTAQRLVALFVGQELPPEHPDFADAVGELVNMVSGNAKGLFTGKSVSIGCPNVIVGEKHNIATASDTPCVVIPCMTDCGELTIEIAIRESTTAASKAA